MAKPSKKKRREVDDDELEESFMDASEIDDAQSWAIYGRAGSGKTTFSATFPKPLLLLDCADKGTRSIKNVKGVKVKQIEDWDDVEDVYWYLKRNKKNFKTVVFDTITQLQQICLRHLLPNSDASTLGDWGTLSKRQWGEASAKMKEVITNFRDLGIEIVFLAQEKTTTGDDEGDDEDLLIPEVGPAAMKSVAAHLNACVSVIGHTHTRIKSKKKEGSKKVEHRTIYCMRIGPNPIYATKVRKPKGIQPPAYIEDPSYDEVMEIIEGDE
jgi:phage nucleotide-binding protein